MACPWQGGVGRLKELLIVYHTQSGATLQLAHAALDGARSEADCRSLMLPAFEAGADDLRAADGLVLCTPENFGYISGGMKDFFDRTFYAVQAEQLNRACALIISAGNDGSGALRQMQRILRGYPMREVVEPLVLHGPPDPAALLKAYETGAALAAGLALGIF